MFNIIKNKKGQTGNTWEDAIALFVIVVLLFGFFIYGKLFFASQQNQINLELEKNSEFTQNQILMNEIAKSHIKIEGQNVSFIDLCRLSKIDPVYQTMLDSKINDIKTIYPELTITELTGMNENEYILSKDSTILIIPGNPELNYKFSIGEKNE